MPLPRQLQFSDIQAAVAGQGVALINLALVADGCARGCCASPSARNWRGTGFHLASAEARNADPDIAKARAGLLDEAAEGASATTAE